VDLRGQLLQVREDYGELTPQVVREAARPDGSPLHELVFDRPVSEAAEAHYLSRARALLRVARIPFREGDEQNPPRSLRAFHAVRAEAGDRRRYVYEPAEEIAVDPLKRRMLLRDMERDWLELKRRWLDFSEFIELVRRDMGEETG
jgi:hypothetical protein